MNHPSLQDDDSGPVIKPRPRRPFDLSSAPPSPSATPPSDAHFFSNLQAPGGTMDGSSTPSRTKSILNLTSSTLFGIYQPTGYATDREEPSTPWGTGAETPAEARPTSMDFSRADMPDMYLSQGPNGHNPKRKSTTAQTHRKPRRSFRGYFLPLAGRVSALFAVGVLYGLLITHLHDRQEIAPVKVEGLDRSGWPYLGFWGAAGVLLGEALPYLDTLWAPEMDDQAAASQRQRSGRGGGGWNDIVRSIGAFVGIAFAIRKLPWQSTLQLSLTLALANPAVWYLIDRSPPGLILSALVALTGTAVLLGINPALVPSPSPAQVLRSHVARNGGTNATGESVNTEELVLGVFSQESVGVATWIASVLFVSCVCFGNIGRRLAPQTR